MTENRVVWLNGALLNSDKANIDPNDRAFLLGDGLFETMAVREGIILRLEAHLTRLKLGCETLRLSWPTANLSQVLYSVVKANKAEDTVLRLTLTRGAFVKRGLVSDNQNTPTLLITTTSWPQPRPLVRCIVAQTTRRNEYSPLSRVKSINYLDSILARQEALDRGGDEAILLNTSEFVAEASVANLFAVKNGRLQTPPITDGALPGVMRAAVLAATHGIEQSIRFEDLYEMDEVFLTNSLGIRSVVSINGKAIGSNYNVAEQLRTKIA